MITAPVLQIRFAKNDRDLARCFTILRELRPQLSPDTFLATIRRMMQDGYSLAMGESGGEVVSVAGYHFSEHLARGRYMYIDDLVTAGTTRRRGHGAQLLAWLAEKARESGCAELHLDSGVQRTEAHLFYEKLGLRFASKHYAVKLA